jgi:diguanylate cyclase
MYGSYNLPLVALSFLIATVASYAALDVAARIMTTRGWMSAYWLAWGAGAMGIGIWSMHFIGMLAFRLPIPMAYEPKVTIASLLIAIGVAAFALYVVSRNALGAPRLFDQPINAIIIRARKCSFLSAACTSNTFMAKDVFST